VGSPTEEQEATGRGAGEHAHGASAPAARATVAESLADIRADRIIGDARREAQAIVDSARVEARREARAIVDTARSEAETIITEAFEQRARIVRRDWAIGDGSWSLSGDEGEGGDGEEPAAAPEPAAGVPTPAGGTPLPVAGAAGDADSAVDAVNGEDARQPLPGVPQQRPPEGAPGPVPDVPAPAVPDIAPRQRPDVAPHPAPEVVPRPAPDVAPRQVPDVAAAAKLSELIELPALRARERMVAPPPGSESPHESRPPLPARIRRRPAPLPRSSPPAPPPPPPPAPPAPTQDRPRPRPRIERELPAGMRIPPDVPDWDDYDDAEDR
jgi:hypothetical protein